MPRARRSKKAAAPASAEPAARLLRGPEAARPLASLIFLAPWLLLYVVGLVWVRPDLAAGADILLRELLTLFGVSGALAPTWLAIIVLVLWHLLRRDPWKISWGLLGLMAAETLLLAVPLFALERVFHAFSHGGWTLALASHAAAHGSPLPAAGPPGWGGPSAWLEAVMTSIGAGIYEELLFRLLMVGGALFLLRTVLKDDSPGAKVAVILMAAALFAGAHVLGDARNFRWLSFLFRTAAGIYLGFVFLYRGFGIAAGVHIVFDLVVKGAAALNDGG